MSESTALEVRRTGTVTVSDIPVLDTAQFEQMARIAKFMANASLIPDALCKDKDQNWLPSETILSNCFMVVNQAVRWNMDPFAVAQCASVVHGRLMWEGKLVQAVIESKMPMTRFDTAYSGEGMGRTITVSAMANGVKRTVSGTVKDWHTKNKRGEMADAWVRQPDTMLHYRGMRQWARQWAPALMLGVYTDDEMDELADASRANAARVISGPPAPPPDTTALPAGVIPAQATAKPRGTTPTAYAEARASAEPQEDTTDAKPATDAAPQAADLQRGPPAPPGEHDASPEAGAADAEHDDAGEAPAAEQAQDAGGEDEPNPEAVLAALESDLAPCETVGQCDAVWIKHEARILALPAAHRQRAQDLFLEKLDRIA